MASALPCPALDVRRDKGRERYRTRNQERPFSRENARGGEKPEKARPAHSQLGERMKFTTIAPFPDPANQLESSAEFYNAVLSTSK